jgi:hypothetical protein
MFDRPHRAPARPPALALGLLFALAGAVGGCALPGAINYKLFGPAPIPARYTPPKTEPMLVLVENAYSGSVAIPEADELSRVIYQELDEHKVAPQVDPAKLADLRDHSPNMFAKLSIAEIGRRLGAKQVLYVHIDRLDLDNPPASDMVKTRMAASVKIVDTTTAMTAFPQSGETEPFAHETPHTRIESATNASELKRLLLRQGGMEIARWFYAWKPETMRDENRDVNLR